MIDPNYGGAGQTVFNTPIPPITVTEPGGVNVQGTVLASPSTVWTGTGVYSRTLQAILSGIGMLRGVNQVPTATQFIQAPTQGAYAYGGQVPAGYYPASAGGNLAGSLQRTIERYPGTVAIVGAVSAALIIGKLVGSSKRSRYA